MATNPSIILSGNNINDVMADQRAKLAQAQEQQTAAQMQALQMAQAKQNFEDDKNFRQAYIAAKGDPTLTVQIAHKMNVGAAKIQQFEQGQAKLLTDKLTQTKLATDTEKADRETTDLKNSEIYGTIQPLLNAKTPEEFEAAKPHVISDLVAKRLLDPRDTNRMKQVTGMSQDDVKMYGAGLLNEKQLTDKAQGDAATSNADSSKRQADAATQKEVDAHAAHLTAQNEKARIDTANKLSMVLQTPGVGIAGYNKVFQGLTPQFVKDNQIPTPEQIAQMPPKQAIAALDSMSMTGHERAQVQQAKDALAQTKVRDANTAANELANLNLRRTEVAISSNREAREASQVGLNVGPDGISPTAKNAFDGFIDPLTLRAMIRKNPGLTDQISKYAESKGKKWDEGKLEGRFNTIKELTNTSASKPGGQLLSASTTVQHAGLFAEAVDAINNGSFVPGNAVFNKFNETFGQAEPNNLTIVAHFLSGEAAKLATGNAPQKGELDAMNKALDRDKSPQALKAAAQTLIKLGAGRLHSIKDLADSHDITDDVVRIVTPDTAEALQRAGIDPKTFKTTQRTSAAPTTAKVATLDHLKAYAASKGISVEQAAAEARKDGYKVQ